MGPQVSLLSPGKARPPALLPSKDFSVYELLPMHSPTPITPQKSGSDHRSVDENLSCRDQAESLIDTSPEISASNRVDRQIALSPFSKLRRLVPNRRSFDCAALRSG